MKSPGTPVTFVIVAALALVLGGCDDRGDAKPAAPAPAAASSAWTFADVTASAGITAVIRSGTEQQEFIPEVKSLGVAILDYDGDGRPDIFFTGGSSLARLKNGEPGYGCFLYRNETTPGGPLRFRDVTQEAKIPSLKWPNGPIVGDYDGDGRPDIFITGFGGCTLLHNRGDGTFEDLTQASGVAHGGWSTGAAFADVDGDGFLDLYVAHYLTFDVNDPPRHGSRYSCTWKSRVVMCGPRGLPAEADVFFRNRGDGTFQNVTKEWGFDAVDPAYGLGVIVADFNRDGKPDVFVANDSSPNHYFENHGGTFIERALECGIAYNEDGKEMAGMGVDATDLNGDGIPDLIVTNFSDQTDSVFLSRPDGRWFESSRSTGVALPSYPMLSWGVGVIDFDNDGAPDIFVSNGHVYPCASEKDTDTSYRQKNQLFHNDGTGKFSEIGASLGDGFAAAHVARGAAFGDLDGDGAVDVVVVNLNDRPTVLQNRLPPGRHYARIVLSEPGGNREAIGAQVTVVAGGRTQTREIRRNYSFQASSEAVAHFGMGAAAAIERVDVKWPDGTAESFGGVAVDRLTTLTRGGGRK